MNLEQSGLDQYLLLNIGNHNLALIMISYPPNLLSSVQSDTETVAHVEEIHNSLQGLINKQRIDDNCEPLHSLFSSRRDIFKSNLKTLTSLKNQKFNDFSLN